MRKVKSGLVGDDKIYLTINFYILVCAICGAITLVMMRVTGKTHSGFCGIQFSLMPV
jgi:hypothetical protein